jgi:hypothetical protein
MSRHVRRAALKQPAQRPVQQASRQGKIHVGAYLPVAFRRGIRTLQTATGEDLQSILGRLLNSEFRQHNIEV